MIHCYLNDLNICRAHISLLKKIKFSNGIFIALFVLVAKYTD